MFLYLIHTDWKKQNRYGVYPEWIEELYQVGYSNVESFTFDTGLTFTHEEWRGRMRTDAAIGGSLNKEKVHEFDKALANLLEKHYSGEVLNVPHRMFAVVCEKGML